MIIFGNITNTVGRLFSLSWDFCPFSDPEEESQETLASEYFFSFSIIAFATSRRWILPVAVLGIVAVKYTFKGTISTF